MPLYEYECTACHRRTEKIQKFSDPELTECPFCGERLERTLTAPAVHFAGGGWYKDLYSSTKPAAGAASGDANTGETKAGGSDGATTAAATGDKAPSSAPAASSSPAPAAAPAAKP